MQSIWLTWVTGMTANAPFLCELVGAARVRIDAPSTFERTSARRGLAVLMPPRIHSGWHFLACLAERFRYCYGQVRSTLFWARASFMWTRLQCLPPPVAAGLIVCIVVAVGAAVEAVENAETEEADVRLQLAVRRVPAEIKRFSWDGLGKTEPELAAELCMQVSDLEALVAGAVRTGASTIETLESLRRGGCVAGEAKMAASVR